MLRDNGRQGEAVASDEERILVLLQLCVAPQSFEYIDSGLQARSEVPASYQTSWRRQQGCSRTGDKAGRNARGEPS